MHNYLTAWMASTALFVVCAQAWAEPAAAPTPPAKPAQPAKPKPPGAEPAAAPTPPAQPAKPSPSGKQPATPAEAKEATESAAQPGTPAEQPDAAASAEAEGAAAAPASPEPASAPEESAETSAPSATPPASKASAPASAGSAQLVPAPRAPWPVPAKFPFALYLNVEPQWNTDVGYDLFDDDDVGTEVGLGVSYEVVEFAPDVALVAELAWGMTSQDQAQLFGGAFTATDLELHRFSAAVGAHYRIVPWVGPHARIAGGVSLFDASFDGRESDARFEDSGMSPFVRFGAGVSAEQSIGEHIALGVLFEGGYTLARRAALELEPRGDSDDDRIDTDYADLGTLSLSGAYLRIGGLVRF